MHKVVFLSNINSEYYHNDELLYIVKRRILYLGFKSICDIYKDGEMIYTFQSSDFTVLFWKLKILFQKLEKKVILKKVGYKYNLIVDNHSIFIKFTNNPFKKVIGKIFLNENCIGEIEKYEKNSKTYFNFEFRQQSGLEYYALILFSMYSVGITDTVV
ncbi:hypothetical protein [Flavobacterium lindanitolerans]|uniref:hypothetical protein n=1 Tax=Flavobacterium lindanitolerans TaxID=428988 RepID=UPI0031DF600F